MKNVHRESIANLRRVFNFFREHPNGVYHITALWPERTYTAAQFQRWFRECLNEKINRETPRSGRKHSQDYFYDVLRLARKLNSNTVTRRTDVPTQYGTDLLARVEHRLFAEEGR